MFVIPEGNLLLLLPLPIELVVLAAFEPDSGPVPGELTHWIADLKLTRRLELPAAYRPLWTDGSGTLALATGVGAARAAASVMALGLDPRFDLTTAWFLVTGVAGIDPTRGSLASVILPEYVVDGDLTHELDAREIPAGWPDGFVPIGKTTPYEQPRTNRFNGEDGIVFQLDTGLVRWAHAETCALALLDTPEMAERRMKFEPAAAHQPPQVLRGDELTSSTFFHGKLLSERAARWVAYQTDAQATYTITAMEDAGILQSLQALARAGRMQWNRILIARAASNFDQQRTGITAAESLVETRVASYSAYRPALANALRVGLHLAIALRRGGYAPPA